MFDYISKNFYGAAMNGCGATACKPDADFDKAVRLLARYIRRHV